MRTGERQFMSDPRVDAGAPLTASPVTTTDNPFIQSLSEYHPMVDGKGPIQMPPSMLSAMKTEWMKRELEVHESEFVEYEGITVMVCTWNVDGTMEPGNMDTWFSARSPLLPDFVFVGLQEVDQSTQAYLYEGAAKEEFWNKSLLDAIHQAYPNHQYARVASRLYVGIYGALFIRQELVPQVSHVSTAFSACGLMGIVGNKGAVSIRLRLHSDYLCFVSAHLAAHVPAVQRRNQDAAEIAKRTLFNASPSLPPAGYGTVAEALMREYRAMPGPAGIWDSSVLLWAGDLNYRIPFDPELVRDLVSEGLYSDLLAHDQLLTERAKGRSIWGEFEEAPIRFPPTFKYDPGTDHFDSSEKNRAPAWCDRILFRRSDNVQCVEYDSVPALQASDHKPIRGLFRTKVRKIVKGRFEETYERLLKKLDQLENELIPVTQLQAHQIDVGNLAFLRTLRSSIEILNIGQVACQFHFVPSSPEGLLLSQPWIKMRPSHGILLPGESQAIDFFFQINSLTCSQYNDKLIGELHHLEDILVIHVEGGRDHFVHITGSFRCTPFCRPLSEISLTADITDPVTGGTRPFRKVPETVWLLIDFILKHGVATVTNILGVACTDEIVGGAVHGFRWARRT